MTKCAQCGREILDYDEAVDLEFTVDEEVVDSEFEELDGHIKVFCSPRCKRDWLDGFVSIFDDFNTLLDVPRQ